MFLHGKHQDFQVPVPFFTSRTQAEHAQRRIRSAENQHRPGESALVARSKTARSKNIRALNRQPIGPSGVGVWVFNCIRAKHDGRWTYIDEFDNVGPEVLLCRPPCAQPSSIVPKDGQAVG